LPYQIQWERPFGVHVRHYGTITPHDVADLAVAVSSDEGFDELRYWIADFRDALDHDLDMSTPGKFEMPFATLIGASHSNPHVHCAFICSNSRIEQALHVAMERKLVPFVARIFRSEGDARDWLGGISGKFFLPPVH
jgi:hypothetical protein